MDNNDAARNERFPGAADRPEASPPSAGTTLLELVLLFTRMGFTAFGGPAAHIALFEDEVVRRRKWLTYEQFLDLLGIVNLIPGPNSTQMVIHIGRMQRGIPGMFAAGLAFIVPASLIVGLCAWLYLRLGGVPQVEGILLGVKPVVIAVIIQALWSLGRKSITTRFRAILAGLSAAAVLAGLGELIVLMLAGTGMALVSAARSGIRGHGKGVTILTGCVAVFVGAAILMPTGETAGPRPFSLTALFLFFFKVGSILYGSGYVLIAFIESSLVNQWEWITETQLLDAVAIGQVTPGPLFTTATFIGFLLAGGIGATVATVGIFVPSFFLIAFSGPLIPRIRQSLLAGAFLDGIILAALALMGVVTLQLGFGIMRDPVSIVLALASAFLLLRYRINSTWLILGGAVCGLLLSLAQNAPSVSPSFGG